MPFGIVHVASEVIGFAKTGGLADVAGALPRALAKRGQRCAVIMPLYHSARTGKIPLKATEHTLAVAVGERTVGGRIWQAMLPDSPVPVYLIEHSDYFERDDPAHGRGLYQFTLPDGDKRDYPDNLERFVYFARAALETIRLLDLWPDVVHCHDWQAGLVPVYLQEDYAQLADPALLDRYRRLRTVFTIHNIAYQGLFPHSDFPVTGLDWRLFNYRQVEFYNHLSFLKAGVTSADWLTTVSPRYAEEIQTPYYGYGLQGALTERRDRLTGIVNGVDYGMWDPAHDPHLAAIYTPNSVAQGKPMCKVALQRRYNLPELPRAPLLTMIARLVEQKGPNLMIQAAEHFLTSQRGGLSPQLVVLGEGDPVYHRMLLDLRNRYRQQVGLTLAFDERLAHQVEAGADMFLMPSMYEPSGLNQLYSLKYGTVPIVRATGGLADTITDCTPQTLANGTATGFSFLAPAPGAFLAAVQRALEMYHTQPEQWLQLMRTGMRQDWSWDRSAAEYEKVYARAVEMPS